MAKLSAKDRAALPDSAFAYVDSRGRRRLPIHDAAHVRNALARFEQTGFEDEAARDRARTRLLQAAKRFGIVPLGFMASQLRAERVLAGRGVDAATLPSGTATFLLADIEHSTALLQRLGDAYTGVLRTVRRLMREGVRGAGGREVDARADEFFAVFERPQAGLEAGVAVHRAMERRRWPEEVDVRVRIGLHTGEATLTDQGYVGLAIHTAARVCFAGHGGQVLVTDATREAIGGSMPEGVGLRRLGRHRLRGLPAATLLYQVEADGLRADFPAPRI